MSELPSNPLEKPFETAAPIVDPKHIDERLDEAVAESFPASDPPAVSLRDDPPAKPWPASEDLPGQSAKARPEPAPAKASRLRKVMPAAAVALVGLGLNRLLRRRHPRR